jgi:hypothetical protein
MAANVASTAVETRLLDYTLSVKVVRNPMKPWLFLRKRTITFSAVTPIRNVAQDASLILPNLVIRSSR